MNWKLVIIDVCYICQTNIITNYELQFYVLVCHVSWSLSWCVCHVGELVNRLIAKLAISSIVNFYYEHCMWHIQCVRGGSGAYTRRGHTYDPCTHVRSYQGSPLVRIASEVAQHLVVLDIFDFTWFLRLLLQCF